MADEFSKQMQNGGKTTVDEDDDASKTLMMRRFEVFDSHVLTTGLLKNQFSN